MRWLCSVHDIIDHGSKKVIRFNCINQTIPDYPKCHSFFESEWLEPHILGSFLFANKKKFIWDVDGKYEKITFLD